MQKVVGSSPIIRSQERPAQRASSSSEVLADRAARSGMEPFRNHRRPGAPNLGEYLWRAGGRTPDKFDDRPMPERAGGRPTGADSRGLCWSEPERTGANDRSVSTSWGSLVRAQYRPQRKGPQTRAFRLQ